MFEKFGFSGTSKLFIRCGEILSNGLYIICTAIGTVFLSSGNPFYGSNSSATNSTFDLFSLQALNLYTSSDYRCFYFGLFFVCIGSLGIYKDQAKQKQISDVLKDENKKMSTYEIALNSLQEETQSYISKISEVHFEMVKRWLKEAYIFFDLEFKGRITIYFNYKDEFYLLSRYSRNPEFSKIHRQKFPLNAGVIGRSWQFGQYLDNTCPNFLKNESAHETYMHDEYGYPREKIKSLNMKSCRYLGVAIVDAGEHVGVLLIESIDEDYLTDDETKNYILHYIDQYQSDLSKFVRDAIAFDKEVISKRAPRSLSVEDDLLSNIGKSTC